MPSAPKEEHEHPQACTELLLLNQQLEERFLRWELMDITFETVKKQKSLFYAVLHGSHSSLKQLNCQKNSNGGSYTIILLLVLKIFPIYRYLLCAWLNKMHIFTHTQASLRGYMQTDFRQTKHLRRNSLRRDKSGALTQECDNRNGFTCDSLLFLVLNKITERGKKY